MTGRYRVVIMGVLLGLLACVPAAAQSGDTTRAQGEVDTGAHVMRLIDDSVVRGWKEDKAYEYANDSTYWKLYAAQGRGQYGRRPYGGGSSGDQPSENSVTRLFASKGFEYFILFLMGGILVFAIVRIILTNRL